MLYYRRTLPKDDVTLQSPDNFLLDFLLKRSDNRVSAGEMSSEKLRNSSTAVATDDRNARRATIQKQGFSSQFAGCRGHNSCLVACRQQTNACHSSVARSEQRTHCSRISSEDGMKIGDLVRWKDSNDMGIVVECCNLSFLVCWFDRPACGYSTNHPCIEVISETR